MTKKTIINQATLFILSVAAFNVAHAEDITFEHLVPAGFSAVEEHNTLQLLGILDGVTLPSPLFFSDKKQQLSFDQQQYRDNHIDEQSIILLERILPQIPYLQCQNGCDYILSGHRITVDKVNHVVTITNNSNHYLMPVTSWGVVHNQFVDLRITAKNYRAVSARGQGYLGLPFQSFGSANWFYNTTRMKNNGSFANQPQYWQQTQMGIGSWYLQKNFQAHYLRAGRQNNLDNSAGSIHTLINPALDQFITLGSQNYLAIDKPSAGSLVLYATSDGDFEIYRDNQLIRRIPAQLGRNEIDYSQLPGGYYNVEIRLVDRTGKVINQDSQTISNIGTQTNNGWFLTLGNGAMRSNNHPHLMQFGRSMNLNSLQTTITLLKDTAKHWAVEGNASRPWNLFDVDLTPTLGLMSGEKHSGGYLRLTGGNSGLGYASVARYQTPDVSIYAPNDGSTSASYSRRFGPTQLSYQFNQYKNSKQHRIQSRWDWRQPQFGLALSLGVQKGGQWSSQNNYGIFLNTSLSLLKSSASINSAYAQQTLTTSASYQKEFSDNYGTSAFGVDGSTSGKTNSFGSFANRSGSRGDVSVRMGVDNKIANGGINYNSMLAISPQGIALGRSSYSGTALLIETPNLADTPYSFRAEGHPITGNGIYVIPVPRYQDRFFVRTHNDRSDIDMNIQLPVSIVRAHPGQVFSSKANITLNLLYSGFFKDPHGQPVSGVIHETGDTVHPNGLFSINSDVMLKNITVQGQFTRYRCDMRQQHDHIYLCHLD
ncbi:alpha-related fimbriae usher protein [Yersinia pekkanenii]|uniref:Alpha-related fimbriae usher protein n=2 Tax=Yersinia pekkanenii TaxID=1288385 RepID=A0A0T9NQN9_9GAMM|nr:TcfC E-set like domain-containing protein [Yersinia pekkanenii]CNH25185.1 alpha-related fimbriae usher protein [Yersinia pekkanenii]CRY67207.1 alpha-related fimbriae usher protein [Yersinia pekkanenii]